jgi:SnoaL-like domain
MLADAACSGSHSRADDCDDPAGCEVSTVHNEQSDRVIVEGIINDAIGWALTKNKERLFDIMAHDAEFFIFHPDSKSTIRGFEAFRTLAERAWMTDAFKATGFAIRDLQVTFSESATVAWYSCFLDDHGEWNGQPVGWTNARWTGVIEKRDGKWVTVQMHFSLAQD